MTLLDGVLQMVEGLDTDDVDILYGEREGQVAGLDDADGSLSVVGVSVDDSDADGGPSVAGVTVDDAEASDGAPDAGIPAFLRDALQRDAPGTHLPKGGVMAETPRRSPVVTRRRALEWGAYAAALALAVIGTLRPDDEEEVAVTEPEATEDEEVVEVTEVYASVPEEATDGFQTVTLVDDESGAISVTGVSDSWDYGYDVEVLLINRTDSDALYQVESGYVDGIRCDPTLLTRVASGQSAAASTYFLGGAYEACGLPFDHVTLTLKMCDADTGDTLTSGTADLYPTGLAADEATDFVREASDTDVSVLDEDGLSICAIGHEALTSGGFALYLLVTNETTEKVYVSLSSASVNGVAADAVCALGTEAGECHLSSITWTADTLSKLGITGDDVEEVGFWLDAKSYEHDDDGDVTGYVMAASAEVGFEVT